MKVVRRMDRTQKEACNEIRELLDRRLDIDEILSDSEDLRADTHLREGNSWEMWTRKTQSIIETAKVMPQFDVSEQLTQSIMGSITAHETAKRYPLAGLLQVLGVLGGLWLVLMVDPYETVWGVMSWVIGLVLLAGIKFLMSDAPGEELTA